MTPTGVPSRDGTARDETPDERANRELIELLNELRVALPGVQVLFAFLLTIPFAQGFVNLDQGDRRVYMAAVFATAGATVCLIAPTAHHRLRFRATVKEHLLKVSNVFTIVGLGLLAFAVTASTWLIADVVFPGTLPRVAATVLAAAFALGWFLLPFLFRSHPTPAPESPAGEATSTGPSASKSDGERPATSDHQPVGG